MLKKKIIAICIIGMFLMMGLTGVTALSVKKAVSGTSEKNTVPLLGYAELKVGRSGIMHISAHLDETLRLPAGDYRAYYKIEFQPIDSITTFKGEYSLEMWAKDDIVFFDYLSNDFEYTGDNTPEDIYIEITKNIPKGKRVVILYISCQGELWENGEVVRTIPYEIAMQDGYYTFPKSKSYINTPLLNFLEQYPILYQLLQRFLRL